MARFTWKTYTFVPPARFLRDRWLQLRAVSETNRQTAITNMRKQQWAQFWADNRDEIKILGGCILALLLAAPFADEEKGFWGLLFTWVVVLASLFVFFGGLRFIFSLVSFHGALNKRTWFYRAEFAKVLSAPTYEAYVQMPGSSRPKPKTGWIWLIGVAIFGWLIWNGNQDASPSSATSPASRTVTPLRQDVPVLPPAQTPSPGVQQVFSTAERIAPFRIVTPAGAENYYVKLVDARTGAPVMTVFVNGGRSLDVDVPLGTYRVRYASGQTWYGEPTLFGPDTSLNESATQFTFGVQGDQVSGYTIELIKQVGGNLQTRTISPGQF